MANFYVNSTTCADWAAGHLYASGDRVCASTGNASAARKSRVYQCTTGGTSGGSEPTWNSTVGGTTTDGGVTWTARDPTTWANAHRYLFHVTRQNVLLTAGDTVYVKDTHHETRTGNQPTYPIGVGSRNTPTRILCVSDGAEPATTLSTGAIVAGSGNMEESGFFYYYGIEFQTGDGVATTQNLLVGSGSPTSTKLTYERCVLHLKSTGGSSQLRIGEESLGSIFTVDFINTDLKFGAAGAIATLYSGQFTFLGGSITGTAPTVLFQPDGSGITDRVLQIYGMDLSLVTGTLYDRSAAATGSAHGSYILFTNCRLGAGVTIFGGTPIEASGIHRAINCASDATNSNQVDSQYYGTLTTDTATYLSAVTAGTPSSRKIVTTANAKRIQPFASPWMTRWNDATGSPLTVSVEIFHDSVTDLKDNEIWLEATYLGSASYPLATRITDASDLLAAGAAQDSSGSSWTNSATNPNAQALSVILTPQMAGPIRFRVCVGKATKTVWYNPSALIT